MLTLKSKIRTALGKKSKSLRKNGLLPAVLYGYSEKSQPLEINLKDFQKVWEEAGESSLIELEIGGISKNVLIKEVQTDPVSDIPVHTDFYAVSMDKIIDAMVPIKFIGESPAVKIKGAIIVRVMHELEIEALPKDLPHELNVDISGLVNFDDRFLVKDLKLPEGVKVLANPEDIIVLTEEPKEEETESVEEQSIENIEIVGKKGKEEDEDKEEGVTEEKKETPKKDGAADSA